MAANDKTQAEEMHFARSLRLDRAWPVWYVVCGRQFVGQDHVTENEWETTCGNCQRVIELRRNRG